ncbi:MAG: DUF2877 domain-containing protein [Pseudomonadota bacterium]|nr:DUF2877 domain-containing protein [Pseudomonadota bacterium]
MRLIVTKISSDWPLGAAKGSVHSVHDRVLNIKFASHGLHSVVDEEMFGEQARVIYVQFPSRFRFTDALTASEAVFLHARLIAFEKAPYFLDLASAATICVPKEKRMNRKISSGRYLESWLAAWNFLTKYDGPKGFVPENTTGPSGGFLTAVADHFWGNLPTLLRNLQLGNLGSSVELASEFRGLGLGYTPSGDDFLTGLLVGADRAASSKAAKDFVGKFGTVLIQDAWVQNELVGKFRKDSFNGYPNLLLREIYFLLERGVKGVPLESTIRNALRCGSTSGWDTVLGLLAGLSLWRSELVARIEMYCERREWRGGYDLTC